MSGDSIAAFTAAFRRAVPAFHGLTVRITGREPWASVTFAGERLRLRVAFEGPGAVGAAADVLARLSAIEPALPGHTLADLTLLAEARHDDGAYARLELEALTIDDG